MWFGKHKLFPDLDQHIFTLKSLPLTSQCVDQTLGYHKKKNFVKLNCFFVCLFVCAFFIDTKIIQNIFTKFSSHIRLISDKMLGWGKYHSAKKKNQIVVMKKKEGLILNFNYCASSLYLYEHLIECSLVACVLRHINSCRLFNAKSCLSIYTYIKYI